jgi:hypothetical protein
MLSEEQIQRLKESGGEVAGQGVMPAMPTTAFTMTPNQEHGRFRVFKGLLWAEWYAHSKLLLGFLGLWLVWVWVFPIILHPGWILLLGLIYAVLAGPTYGGSDVVEGCEEFTFALPATRSQRYLARLAVGGGALLLLTVLDVLALGLDLSTVLARFYITTGLIKPLPVLKTGLLYGLLLGFPLAVFSFSFVLSAVVHSRFVIFTAWFWGGLAALAGLYLGLQFEELIWNQMNGFVSFPLLLTGSAAGLWAGHWVYRRKEIGAYSAPITLPVGWWLWGILWLAGIALALWLVLALAKQYPKFLSEKERIIHAQFQDHFTNAL